MKEIVLNNKDKKINLRQYKFIRNKHNWSIQSNYIYQFFGMVYDKRIINSDLTTKPYGFKS